MSQRKDKGGLGYRLLWWLRGWFGPCFECGRCNRKEALARQTFPLCRYCWKLDGLDEMDWIEQTSKLWPYLRDEC